ncbi:MAG TPA: metalloregulator ArsR/SmtB family transcription factor [Trueperaceae bacterium]
MEDLATQLKALADPTRLNILEFLKNPQEDCCSQESGVCACDFEDLLGLSQPTISHHMKQLVQAGFVTAEKRGRWMFYDLNPATFERVASQLAHFAQTPKAC